MVQKLGKKRKKGVKLELEQEIEFETNGPSKEVEKIKVGGGKRRKVDDF